MYRTAFGDAAAYGAPVITTILSDTNGTIEYDRLKQLRRDDCYVWRPVLTVESESESESESDISFGSFSPTQ